MKIYVRSNNQSKFTLPIDLSSLDIQSVVFVSDASEYRPGSEFITASSHRSKPNYRSYTHDQLLQLPKKEFERIDDIEVLKKLKLEELTFNQRRLVTQLYEHNKFKMTESEVNSILDKLRNERSIFIFPTQKNKDFSDRIADLGGEVSGKDVAKIVKTLNYNDYQNSTYSCLSSNWGALLMIFKFQGSYTFQYLDDDSDPVTVSDFQICIKLDVETKSKKGYTAISFHEPEYNMK